MKKIITLCILLSLISCTAPAEPTIVENHNPETEEVKIEVLAETSNSWDGKQLPNYPTTTPKITILRYTFPPHVKLEPHRHLIINCGVMIRGQLTIITLDGQEKTFKAGDAIVELVGDAHYGENRGDEPAELIIFYAGTEGLALKEPIQSN